MNLKLAKIDEGVVEINLRGIFKILIVSADVSTAIIVKQCQLEMGAFK